MHRRTFLKLGTLAVSGLSAVPYPAAAAVAEPFETESARNVEMSRSLLNLRTE